MAAGAIILLAFATLGWRYYSLQIVEYQRFLVQSERNRVRLEAVPPKRGLIYDRKGRLLASNEPSHRLSVVVERVDDLDALLTQLRELVAISED
jgi:penicillin-binding protein 2